MIFFFPLITLIKLKTILNNNICKIKKFKMYTSFKELIKAHNISNNELYKNRQYKREKEKIIN